MHEGQATLSVSCAPYLDMEGGRGMHGTHATDIVGYTFDADEYCVDCMREIAVQRASELGSTVNWGDVFDTAERALDEWAGIASVNRQDEESFDSMNFPKVIFASMVESADERCGKCHESLIPD